jgi:hypothetical protein
MVGWSFVKSKIRNAFQETKKNGPKPVGNFTFSRICYQFGFRVGKSPNKFLQEHSKQPLFEWGAN